jgi:tricorn protease
MDDGYVMAPRWAFYGLDGQWEIENHGVAPDVEVEQDPKLCREGHDPQLERAVAVALKELDANPEPAYKRPQYPNYHPKLAIGTE